MIRDSRIQCYIKKIGIHHYCAFKAKVVISFQIKVHEVLESDIKSEMIL